MSDWPHAESPRYWCSTRLCVSEGTVLQRINGKDYSSANDYGKLCLECGQYHILAGSLGEIKGGKETETWVSEFILPPCL